MTAATPAASAAPASASAPPMVVAIGASAGGITALKTLFSLLPTDAGVAYVVVLHLSPSHESHLAAILQSETSMPVSQVVGPTTLEPDHVYVNPPDRHLEVLDGKLELVASSPTPGRRNTIDLLFCSLAAAMSGDRIVCILLSGTGSDGTVGLWHVREVGGTAIVQDPEEAEYNAMALSAIAAGGADLIVRIADMPGHLMTIAHRPAVDLDIDDEAPEATSRVDATSLAAILTTVRERTGHDFSGYKPATLLRRILRRIGVRGVGSLREYADAIAVDAEEAAVLSRDFLISVTSFFRDPEAFDALEQTVIPRLFAGKGASDTVRVWVAGCATGEEAYSVGMLLCEHADRLNEPPRLQVFASDIDAEAIRIARDGRYGEVVVASVSPQRMQRFFVSDGPDFRAKKELRDIVLFARHNLLQDAPFSQLDLVTCRNLLIYLRRDAQYTVLRTLHFALRRDGHLMLGSSETGDTADGLFTAVDRQHHIYRALAKAVGTAGFPLGAATATPAQDARRKERLHPESPGAVHHRLVESYAPPSLLLDDGFDVLHLSPTVGRYLQFQGGEISRNILSMIQTDLRAHLRDALLEAKQSADDAPVSHGTVRRSDPASTVTVSVRRCRLDDSRPCYLVMFDESEALPVATAGDANASPDVRSTTERLESELREASDRLRARSEQNETAEQELRSTNEELRSIIEELRSAGEEVETSKEELQSVNEELSTVNSELKNKIEEVSVANADLQNLLASTDIATIFLDSQLRIRRFTPLATALVNLIESDIGRPLSHLTHRLDYDEFEADATVVLRSLHPIEREVRSIDERSFILRLLPYRTIDQSVEGVVMTFVDITERKLEEESRRWLSEIVASSNDAIVSFTLDGDVRSWNGSAERMFGYAPGQILGRSIETLAPAEMHDELGRMKARLRRGESIANLQMELVRNDGTLLDVSMSISPIATSGGGVRAVTAILQDVTEQRRAQAEIDVQSRRKDEFLAMLAHELRNPLAPILSGLDVLRECQDDAEATSSAIGIIERQARQMIRLVDDLLDVSRITRGAITLQRERIDLRNVVAMAEETIRPLIAASRGTLQFSIPTEPVFVDGDAARLTQIVVNLLSNAAKYSEPGSTITLEMEAGEETVEICVSDDGIGIATADLPAIFEMFTRIDRGPKHARIGLGVGLSVVRTLVTMHGGTITARSEGEGKGSTFTVQLPIEHSEETLVEARSDGAPAEKLEPGVATPMRVLVVDDNTDAAEMLAQLLREQRHEVRIASDGASAVAAALAFEPDACLLDIGLPDFDGYEVARRIRATDAATVLIAVTGWGTPADRERSHDAGIQHHLVKPVRFEVISRLLADAPRSDADAASGDGVATPGTPPASPASSPPDRPSRKRPSR